MSDVLRWVTTDIGFNYSIVNRQFSEKIFRGAVSVLISRQGLAQRNRPALSSPAPRLAYGGMLIGR